MSEDAEIESTPPGGMAFIHEMAIKWARVAYILSNAHSNVCGDSGIPDAERNAVLSEIERTISQVCKRIRKLERDA